MKIGFIGLGQMGKPMAMNLLKCGAEIIVKGLRTHTYPEFEAHGAKTTTKLKDIAGCELIFLSLPDAEVVQRVLLEGLRDDLKKGQVIVDLGTTDYTISTAIAKSLAEIGVEFMDAPVSGMEARAKDGTLTMMCGGKKEIFELLMPYLKYMGETILYMGTHGCGQLTKAINNTLFDINIAAFAEILPMAVKLGLDSEQIGVAINSSSGKSYASSFFIPRILNRNFNDGYPLKHAYKDLVGIVEISAHHCIPLPVTHAATTTYQMAMAKGLGRQDKGAMTCVFEDLLGVKCEKKSAGL